MDDDRLFKELLSNFFLEFLQLFLPDVAAALDEGASPVPMDIKGVADDKHAANLAMRAKIRGQDAVFLVHIAGGSHLEPAFARRMFRDFARLTEKYDLPVYPVVVFSHDSPQQPEPDHFVVAFPGRTVLRFEYSVIPLNRLSWQQFATQPNPAACALMAKMRMSPEERPLVKLECLRLLTKLKLDPARSRLIGGFIDSSLVLEAEEMRRFEQAIAQWPPADQEEILGLITSWEQNAITKGKAQLVQVLLEYRFSTLPPSLTKRLDGLTSDELDDLGKAIFRFMSIADLETWLDKRQK